MSSNTSSSTKSNSSNKFGPDSLTRNQRDFYNKQTPGIKSFITKSLITHNGNTPAFKSWFTRYKKSNG